MEFLFIFVNVCFVILELQKCVKFWGGCSVTGCLFFYLLLLHGGYFYQHMVYINCMTRLLLLLGFNSARGIYIII